jgi:hypothetical protein
MLSSSDVGPPRSTSPCIPARNRQPRSTAISLARLPCPPRPRPLQQPPPPPFSLFFNSGESASPPLTVNCPRPPSALLLSHDPSSPSTSELPRRRLPSAARGGRRRRRRCLLQPLWVVRSLVLSVLGAREKGEEKRGHRGERSHRRPQTGGIPRRRRRAAGRGPLEPAAVGHDWIGWGENCFRVSKGCWPQGYLYHRSVRAAVGSNLCRSDGCGQVQPPAAAGPSFGPGGTGAQAASAACPSAVGPPAQAGARGEAVGHFSVRAGKGCCEQ